MASSGTREDGDGITIAYFAPGGMRYAHVAGHGYHVRAYMPRRGAGRWKTVVIDDGQPVPAIWDGSGHGI